MSESKRSHVVLNAPNGTGKGASFTVDGVDLTHAISGVSFRCEVGEVNRAVIDLVVTGTERAEMNAELVYLVDGFECAKCSCSQLVPVTKPQ